MLFLRDARREAYKCFNDYVWFQEKFPLLSMSDLDEASRVLTFSAIEWYQTIPVLNHYQCQLVSGLYRVVLAEMIGRDDLRGTHGWEEAYVQEVLIAWSKSPVPEAVVGLTMKQRKQLMMRDGCFFHPIPAQIYSQVKYWARCKKRKLRKNHRDFDLSEKGREKSFNKCAYCLLSDEKYPCMADNEKHGPCSTEDLRFRCSKKAGIHLCNAHGHKLILVRQDRNIGKFDSEERAYDKHFYLKDGRVVPHIGLLRYFYKEKCTIYPLSKYPYGRYEDFVCTYNVNPFVPLGVDPEIVPNLASFHNFPESREVFFLHREKVAFMHEMFDKYGDTDCLFGSYLRPEKYYIEAALRSRYSDMTDYLVDLACDYGGSGGAERERLVKIKPLRGLFDLPGSWLLERQALEEAEEQEEEEESDRESLSNSRKKVKTTS